MSKLVLIVDDEKPIVDILKYNFIKEGYETIEAYDGAQALEYALEKKPDIILLDVMLPKMDGFEVCRKVREKMSTPILMLTAREEEVDKVLGLELGADDYITKPFSPRELMARVKANLRRSVPDEKNKSEDEENKVVIGRISLDLDRYEVKKDGEIIDLTVREFELLKFLALQPDKVFTREKLLEKVWDYDYYGDQRTVDVTIRRLREKIEDDPGVPNFVVTKRGVGYCFNKDNK